MLVLAMQGQCAEDGTCDCETQYWGSACQQDCLPKGNPCNGHGTFDYSVLLERVGPTNSEAFSLFRHLQPSQWRVHVLPRALGSAVRARVPWRRR